MVVNAQTPVVGNAKMIMNKGLLILLLYLPLIPQAQQWSSLGNGVNGSFPYVYAMLQDTSTNNLFVGGRFTEAGSINANNIAIWDGNTWDTLGSGMNNAVRVLQSYNGELYAGGFFSTAGNISASGIAKWDGSKWDSLGPGLQTSGAPYSMAVYNGELYIGGVFNTLGDGTWVKEITRWNGSNFQTVGGGVSGPFLGNPQVNALAVYNGSLYAGGYFDLAGSTSVSHIAKWDGANWSTVGSGVDNVIFCMTVFNGELFVGGAISQAGGNNANYIAKWNGSSWDSLGYGANFTVRTMYTTDSCLYIGGWFSQVDSVNTSRIAKWNGVKWDSLGAGLDDDVYSIAGTNENLFAGGRFITSSGDSMNYIAQWTSVTGMEEYLIQEDKIEIYPNPATTGVNIRYENKMNLSYTLKLFDLTGKEIKTMNKINSNEVFLPNEDYKAGMYILELFEGNDLKAYWKIIFD